ncbi:MAG: ParA family protein, partial [Burkholderiales bacterium]|nr:ParA family protein [Burkholderiales bacterium]
MPHLIVPTLFDKRTRASRQTLDLLQERYGQALWELVIPVDTQLRDASRNGAPLP